jgi:hypothetical protein
MQEQPRELPPEALSLKFMAWNIKRIDETLEKIAESLKIIAEAMSINSMMR